MKKTIFLVGLVVLVLFGCIQQPPANNASGPPTIIPPSLPPTLSQQYDTQVTIDAGKRYQTMIGFGSAYLGRFDEPHMLYGSGRGTPKDTVPEADKEKILDLVYSNLGLDTTSIQIRHFLSPSYEGWQSWEPVNDNEDPDTINWASLSFNRSYWDGLFDIVKKSESRIRATGVKPTIIFKDSWGVEPWMAAHENPNQLQHGMEAEYAEWVLEIIEYARDNYNITPDYVIVMNEPDGVGSMDPLTTVNVVKAMGRLFDREGIPTKIGLPETYLPNEAPPYLQAVLADPDAAKYVKLVTYHAYDRDLSVNATGDVLSRQQIKSMAAQLNATVQEGELSTCCKENIETFWWNTYDQALAWANDFHNEITVTGASGLDMQTPFWSTPEAYVLLNFDENKNYLGYEPTKIYYPLGQYIKFVRPGMVRVDATSNNSDVLVSAYINDNDKSIVIVAINNANEERNASVSFASGAPTTLTGTMSSETENWKDIGNAQIENGQFSVTLAPRSVSTYVSSLPFIPPPQGNGNVSTAGGAWYDGDAHIHGYGCGGQREPEELMGLMNQGDINVGSTLIWGQSPANDYEHFTGQDSNVSTSERIIHYDVEVSEFTPDPMGHLIMLGLKNISFPRRLYRLPMAQWAKAQGAVTGFAHADLFSSNYQMPALSVTSPSEAPIDVALGQIDFIETELGPSEGFKFLWTALENSGFRLAVVGASDLPCVQDKLGKVQTYFWSATGPSYDAWLNALRNGRTIMSVDKNFIAFTANGANIGDEISLSGAGNVALKVQYSLSQPAQARIVVNGQTVDSRTLPSGSGSFDTNININRSSWVAIESDSAITSAIYVLVDGKSIRPSSKDPEFFVDYLDYLTTQIQNGALVQTPPLGHPPFQPIPAGIVLADEQNEVLAAINQSKTVFAQRAAEANAQ